jgi:hypothetical protein
VAYQPIFVRASIDVRNEHLDPKDSGRDAPEDEQCSEGERNREQLPQDLLVLRKVVLFFARDRVSNLLLPDILSAVDLLLQSDLVPRPGGCSLATFRLPIPCTSHRRLRLISSSLQYSRKIMHQMIVRMAYVLEMRCRSHQAKIPVTDGKINAIIYVCRKQK